MKALSFVSAVTSLMALSTTVFCMPSALQERQNGNGTDTDGLPFGNQMMTFEGPAFPNGPNITFTGTPEGFWNKVHQLNPNYDNDFKDVIAAQDAEDEDEVAHTKAFCYHDDYAHTDVIRDGIKYLHGITASCSSIKNFCERVSCSYDSGIYLCNNLFHKIFVRCDRVAKLASHGLKVCATGNNVQTSVRSGDGWVVDIRGTDC